MECVIPQRSVKLFVKTLQCLGKIGQDIFIEPKDRQLLLRSINDSRSAYAAFRIDQSFFEEYNQTSEDIASVKVQAKNCISVFKNLNSIETCTIRIDQESSVVVFDLLCRLGVKKNYKLSFEELKPIQAIYDKVYPNKVVARPRMLLDSIQNFHSSLEEITMIVNQDSLILKSYIDETSNDANRILRTELTIEANDFEEFSIESHGAELVFGLKEAKALLNYCEVAGQPLIVNFDRPGRPMLLSLKYFNVIDADLVLATMFDNNNSSGSVTSPSPSPTQTPSASPASSSTSSMTASDMTSSASITSSYVNTPDPTPPRRAIPPSPISVNSRNDTVLGRKRSRSPSPSMSMDTNGDYDDAGHVSGSDDEDEDESLPLTKKQKTGADSSTTRRKPVFSTDFKNFDRNDGVSA